MNQTACAQFFDQQHATLDLACLVRCRRSQVFRAHPHDDSARSSANLLTAQANGTAVRKRDDRSAPIRSKFATHEIHGWGANETGNEDGGRVVVYLRRAADLLDQ